MFSKDFLTSKIPVLNLQDTGAFSLLQMEACKRQHLPVVEKGKYVFLLSENDVSSMENQADKIENLSTYAPFANEQTMVLEVLQIMNKNRIDVLPVVNATGDYLGAVTSDILIEKMSELCNMGRGGAFIILELNSSDYSLSQIIHLAEQNRACVLNVFSYVEESSGKFILILIIDSEDASNVVRSLERFDYKVIHFAQKQKVTDETLHNRLNELMFYLEL
ncbi:MAG: CBS domain-containing protein [Candidatus Azobacteroides sp.]|nr:CBS domain-containing protein [Candidatus Azobacteroides sp.]